VYYHAGFWSLGPHLAEGCSPFKMAYSYKEAAERNTLYYSILNISNVRPLHVSAMIYARILENPQKFDAARELLLLDGELFGAVGNEVNALRRAYYESFADFGEASLRFFAESCHFYLRNYEALPFIRNAATDGQLSRFGKYLLKGKAYAKTPPPTRETMQMLQESAEKLSVLYDQAEMLEMKLSADRLSYFRQFLKHQIGYMRDLNEWCAACIGLMDRERTTAVRCAYGETACAALERILADRHVLEEGKWEHWHRGDKKINIPALLKATRNALNDVADSI